MERTNFERIRFDVAAKNQVPPPLLSPTAIANAMLRLHIYIHLTLLPDSRLKNRRTNIVSVERKNWKRWEIFAANFPSFRCSLHRPQGWWGQTDGRSLVTQSRQAGEVRRPPELSWAGRGPRAIAVFAAWPASPADRGYKFPAPPPPTPLHHHLHPFQPGDPSSSSTPTAANKQRLLAELRKSRSQSQVGAAS